MPSESRLLTLLPMPGVLSSADFEGLPRPAVADSLPISAVQEILEVVRVGGDRALIELTRKFDNVDIESVRVPVHEIAEARRSLARESPELERALVAAHQRIKAFQDTQRPPDSSFREVGINIATSWKPVARAGCYVPGGRAIYPSTVLMTATLANVAGVPEVVLCVPPDGSGQVPLPILAAANIAGVSEVYRVGGAQAVAAMAYGTESIPAVDVIVGPGNIYVATAMRLVSDKVGIPSAFAGPSEVVVIADETTPVELAAWDLVVQAEHGPDGLAWLITWSADVAEAVSAKLEELVDRSPRKQEIQSTLAKGGYAVVVDNASEAVKVSNKIAPEHLEIMSDNASELASNVTNAGAVFIGSLTSAAIGDYAAGPSHVLPVFGSGRYASVLRVTDFMKTLNYIEAGADALPALDEIVSAIGNVEGLPAHAGAVAARINAESRT